MTEKITVFNPEGSAPKVDGKGLAPRPDTLAGKNVFLVDVGFDNSGEFMGQLADWFALNRPETKTTLVRLNNPFNPDPDTYARIGAEGDLAVLGVGL